MKDTNRRSNMDDPFNRILDATDKLLAVHGYKKMKVEDIAKEAGIGKGSVYLHFHSKDEIVLGHIDRIIDRLIEKLTKIAQEDLDATQRIKKMLVTRVLFRFDSVQSYSQGLNELLVSLRSILLLRREKYFAMEASLIAGVLKEFCNTNKISIKHELEVAKSMILATNSLLPFDLSVNELGKRNLVKKNVGQIADLIIYGIHNLPK